MIGDRVNTTIPIIKVHYVQHVCALQLLYKDDSYVVNGRKNNLIGKQAPKELRDIDGREARVSES